MIIGTCSICSGPVNVRGLGESTDATPPVPTCLQCGATKRYAYGPVIDMVPRREIMTQQDFNNEWDIPQDPAREKADMPSSYDLFMEEK